jgi:hypothetical protein
LIVSPVVRTAKFPVQSKTRGPQLLARLSARTNLRAYPKTSLGTFSLGTFSLGTFSLGTFSLGAGPSRSARVALARRGSPDPAAGGRSKVYARY